MDGFRSDADGLTGLCADTRGDKNQHQAVRAVQQKNGQDYKGSGPEDDGAKSDNAENDNVKKSDDAKHGKSKKSSKTGNHGSGNS
ncbi:MAG: hypothetical protein DMG67_06280 [Acidobacteria bacterium]|nr:MAG: hypothetical protein DMG67_06280 [Acidobacteriota bacterium]